MIRRIFISHCIVLMAMMICMNSFAAKDSYISIIASRSENRNRYVDFDTLSVFKVDDGQIHLLKGSYEEASALLNKIDLAINLCKTYVPEINWVNDTVFLIEYFYVPTLTINCIYVKCDSDSAVV